MTRKKYSITTLSSVILAMAILCVSGPVSLPAVEPGDSWTVELVGYMYTHEETGESFHLPPDYPTLAEGIAHPTNPYDHVLQWEYEVRRHELTAIRFIDETTVELEIANDDSITGLLWEVAEKYIENEYVSGLLSVARYELLFVNTDREETSLTFTIGADRKGYLLTDVKSGIVSGDIQAFYQVDFGDSVMPKIESPAVRLPKITDGL